LRGYTVKYIKNKLIKNETEEIIYILSEGDAAKRNLLLKTKRRVILDYYYQLRLRRLNELIETIAQLKQIKRDK